MELFISPNFCYLMFLDFWATFKRKLEMATYDHILSDLQKDHNNKSTPCNIRIKSQILNAHSPDNIKNIINDCII